MKATRITPLALALLLGVGAVSLAHADVSTSLSGLSGRSTVSHVSAPGRFVNYTADVLIDFDNPQNLSPSCLNVSAVALDAAGKADVQSRLPSGNLVVDDAFPVKITIQPLASCNFSFNNTYGIEVHTGNLPYTAGSPYRLYKAPVGGAYRDITSETLEGSFRARGRGGAFSEFVVVKDTTQPSAAQASAQYAAIQPLVRSATPGLGTLMTNLNAHFVASQNAFNTGNYTTAASELQAMEVAAGQNAGSVMTNIWQPGVAEDTNSEGMLVSRSANLRFLLGRLNGNP